MDYSGAEVNLVFISVEEKTARMSELIMIAYTAR